MLGRPGHLVQDAEDKLRRAEELHESAAAAEARALEDARSLEAMRHQHDKVVPIMHLCSSPVNLNYGQHFGFAQTLDHVHRIGQLRDNYCLCCCNSTSEKIVA